MSWQPADDPECKNARNDGAITLVITPKEHDIGGLIVRRSLPNRNRRSVGPFVFLDQMGPAVFKPGQGIDVRPHPHIGLATITYLYDGVIGHKDSLGVVQESRPGEIIWVTAGRGIVHSERTPGDVRAAGGPLFGLQAWVALPIDAEETAPSFVHYPAEDLPRWRDGGTEIALIAGTMAGRTSPVEFFSPIFYADLRLAAGAAFTLPPDHAERAAHVAEGEVAIDGQTFQAGQTVIFREGPDVILTAQTAAKVMVFGGAPLDIAPDARPNQPRQMFWNFVSHSADRIEQAKDDWKNGRFDMVPGDDEFIPLPE
ncbi:MAG: pirin family protein [Rhodospirillales bacterium]